MDRIAQQSTVAGMVTCSSYVLFAGMAGQQMGVIPLINNRFGPFNATAEQKVKAWNAYFPTAMRWALAPAIANAGLSFTYAYLQPIPTLRYLALASGLLSISVAPVTWFLGLLPINAHLLGLGTRIDRKEIVDWDKEGKKAEENVRKWEEKHVWRFGNFVGAWVCGMAVLVGSL